MIVKQKNKYVVIDTETKAVISEHAFEDTKKSMAEAERLARESNAVWKESK